MNQLQRLFQFGVFEVDTAARELRKGGLRVRIQDQPFELLAMLLQRPGEIVSRDAVREALWTSDTFVDFDHSLGTAVAKLRAALGDSARNPRFVETVANHGYKFIAPVTVVPAAPAVALAPLDLFVATPDASTRFVRWWTLRVASGLAVGAALLAVVLGLDLFAARDWLRQRTNPTIEALAVLPFENLSGDQGDSYLVDGVTESLITSLAQLRGARVISRTSSMQYRGTKKSLPAIAQELHVDALVEGSVVRSGSRVRVSAKLVDARTDAHLWARSYERDVRDVLTLQADVAQAIAEVLRVGREPGPQSSARSHRVLPDAQDAYLRGRYHLNQGEELSIRKSVDDSGRRLPQTRAMRAATRVWPKPASRSPTTTRRRTT